MNPDLLPQVGPSTQAGKSPLPTGRPAAGRLYWLDLLRGGICLSIVAVHLLPLPGGLYPFLPRTECFMVLSGYFLGRMLRPAGRGVALRRVVRGRLARLVLPYQAAVLLCLPIKPGLRALAQAAGVPGHGQPPTAHEFAATLLVNLAAVPDLYGRGHADAGVYWSMAVLLQATALTVCGCWLLRRLAPRNRPSAVSGG